MEVVGLDRPMTDDAAVVLHSGFLFWAHHGDWAGNDTLGLCSNTDIRHVVSFTIFHR